MVKGIRATVFYTDKKNDNKVVTYSLDDIAFNGSLDKVIKTIEMLEGGEENVSINDILFE